MHQPTLVEVDPSLEISSIQLPKEVLGLLEASLDGNPFKSIRLRRNNGGRDIVNFVTNLVNINSEIKKLHLIDNPIHEDDFNALTSVVSNSSLHEIKFKGSCRRLSYNNITTLFSQCTNLWDIDLSGNEITTNGDTFLSNFLETNTTLHFLRLGYNNLNNHDAIAIARALVTNKALMLLNLTGNNITQDGENALLETVFDTSSLNAASDSNHTCLVICGSDWMRQFNHSSNTLSHRRQKLYHILSKRNRESSNVELMDEHLSREHIPTLLKSIQEYSMFMIDDDVDGERSDSVQPLSIMYEVLRSWNMPVLYERGTSGTATNGD